MVTEKPRALSSLPKDAAVIPFPKPETTPPVTNTYFTRCTFEYNTSPRGGALANHEGIYDIRNSIFTENTVGGAIDIFSGQDLIIEGSTFVRNQSDGSGGAIDFNGNLTSRINRTIFSANSATFSGGAIDNSGGLKITNSIFV